MTEQGPLYNAATGQPKCDGQHGATYDAALWVLGCRICPYCDCLLITPSDAVRELEDAAAHAAKASVEHDFSAKIDGTTTGIQDIGEKLQESVQSIKPCRLSAEESQRLLSFLECAADYEKGLEMEVERARSRAPALEAPEKRDDLKHAMNCPQSARWDGECTCGLTWRIQLQTEREMHNAWRKRAEEAEVDCQKLEAMRQRMRKVALRHAHFVRRLRSSASSLPAFESQGQDELCWVRRTERVIHPLRDAGFGPPLTDPLAAESEPRVTLEQVERAINNAVAQLMGFRKFEDHESAIVEVIQRHVKGLFTRSSDRCSQQ